MKRPMKKAAALLEETARRALGERATTFLRGAYRRAVQELFEKRDGLLAFRLQTEIREPVKIGMAVLAHERPEYLELCLDSLFRTKLYGYDITFLIQDDGSTDPRVREIIDRPRDPQYKIVRSYTPKGHDSWGAAFNRAMRKLLEIDAFDIIGSCDSDAIFHPEWLDKTMKICLWAKRHHNAHILGPFSSFNSSDYRFHRILGSYPSPHGSYVVKCRMGALNYFYFKSDFLKLGFYDEDKNDETIMTERFSELKVRNFCTETSYVEHVGQLSVLNRWRPVPVRAAVHGFNLPREGWGAELEVADTLGYYRDVRENRSMGENVSSDVSIDILIPAIPKDMVTLPHVLRGIRKYLRHPVGTIFIIAPEDREMERVCSEHACTYVPEESLSPVRKGDLHYRPNGVDRTGWLYQQLLKLSGDRLSRREQFLCLDSDTVLTCPQIFVVDGRTVLLHSDEHHHPYFEMYRKLFGVNPSSHLSFVAHQMLFRSQRLAEMKQVLERRHATPWYQAILDNLDQTELSSFSEYETYGQWMLQNHPDDIWREYWFNASVSRSQGFSGDGVAAFPGRRSVSCHSWKA